MPFDGKTYREPLKPGLAGLAQLRDELLKPMPENHRWVFGHVRHEQDCGTSGCAIGLATVLWPKQTRNWLGPHGNISAWPTKHVAEDLGLDTVTFKTIFLYPCTYHGEERLGVVTPHMVANKITEHLNAVGFVESVAAE